jgi:hypothetical protein
LLLLLLLLRLRLVLLLLVLVLLLASLPRPPALPNPIFDDFAKVIDDTHRRGTADRQAVATARASGSLNIGMQTQCKS